MAGQVVALFDARTGEIVEADSCPNCRVNKEDASNITREYKKALRRIRALEREREQEQILYAHRQTVIAYFEFWQTCTGHTKSVLDADRFDRIKWAIEHTYTDEQIRLAIIGAAVECFVDGKGKHHDSIDLIFRNADKIEDFALRGWRWGKKQMAA